MAFQIKNFTSIVAGALNLMRGSTDKIKDFRAGSVSRTLIEGPAIEIDELYQQMFIGLREAIPVSTFLSFGFDKLPAKRAFGYVSVSSSAPLTQAITIPVGTVFSTSAGGKYTSTAQVVWASGTSLVSIPVQAVSSGFSGNASAASINQSDLFPASSGFTVGNSEIANGADAETDAEREVRFADFVSALSRGTVQACLYGAGSATVLALDGTIDEYVTRRGYEEIPGRMRIWIYSNRGVASSLLLDAGQDIIDGYRKTDGTIVPGFRPAGVRVDVLPMAERTVPMSIGVTMLQGYVLDSAVRQDLTDIYNAAIRSVEPGETLLLDALVTDLLTAPGVSSVVPQSTSNITCAAGEALVPGTLTIASL